MPVNSLVNSKVNHMKCQCVLPQFPCQFNLQIALPYDKISNDDEQHKQVNSALDQFNSCFCWLTLTNFIICNKIILYYFHSNNNYNKKRFANLLSSLSFYLGQEIGFCYLKNFKQEYSII